MLQIVIVGVGGQGTLLTSRILGDLAIHHGMDVKVSEVHGMSQRGGSVITYVRIGTQGETIHTPLVEKQCADFILAFEQLEAYRALPYLKKGGKVITGDQKILPMPVITGAMQYPDNVLEAIGQKADVIALDALHIAKQCGSIRAANIVLIGVLAGYLPFDKQEVASAVARCVPPKTVEMNLRAFEAGYQQGV